MEDVLNNTDRRDYCRQDVGIEDKEWQMISRRKKK